MDNKVKDYISKYTSKPTQEFLKSLYVEKGIEFEYTLQIHYINLGIEKSLSEDRMLFYANPAYSAEMMSVLYSSFCKGATVKQAELALELNPRKNAELEIILDFLLDGFSTEEINFFRDLFWKGDRAHRSKWLICKCKKAIKNGLPAVWIYRYIRPKDDDSKVNSLEAAYKAGLTVDQADKYEFASRKAQSIEYIGVALLGNYTNHRQPFSRKYTEDEIEIFSSTDLGSTQMREIILGIEHGLSEEQIQKFSDSKMSFKQMRVIREAIEEGKPEEYVDIFTDTGFNPKQVFVLKNGYEKGLSIQQLSIVAKSHINSYRMKELIEETINSNKIYSAVPSSESKNTEESIFSELYDSIKTHANSLTLEQKKAIVNALLFEE